MPVGRKTLGRIANVIGDPVDDLGPIFAEGEETRHLPFTVHLLHSKHTTEVEMFETGIKVIDLLLPTLVVVRLVSLVVRCRKTVLIMELINNVGKGHGGFSVFGGVGGRTVKETFGWK